MVRFHATIEKFKNKGEKSGWTYIAIPSSKAAQLNPGIKKSFRIKGMIDSVPIEGLSLLPMGNGDFILALNATIRKKIKKLIGDKIYLQIVLDKNDYQLPEDFIECLKDDPEANNYFNSLAKSHRNYFGKWIEEAKTETTRTRRLAHAISALSKKIDFGQMLRSLKNQQRLPDINL
ncbi:MAG: YdeI/OmpD-associated family protein [Chitinophagaceae bacterium]